MNSSLEPDPFFSVRQLSFSFDSRQILDQISFNLPRGSLAGLLGNNGIGKTTLLRTLCGLLPHAGSCTLAGKALEKMSERQLAQNISYIPQRNEISISLSALDVVLMGFHSRLGLFQAPSAGQRRRALEALETVGLANCADQEYHTLSEGQRQLCLLARTLVEDTGLLILDEPDSALDFANRHLILRTLQKLTAGQDRAGLLCLHDPWLALEYCDPLLLLRDARTIVTLHPLMDTCQEMQEHFREIYGPLSLRRCEDGCGRSHLVLLPESED